MQPGSDREIITCYISSNSTSHSEDVVLIKVLEYIQYGWPKQEEALVPYWNRSQQLSVEDGFWDQE